MPLFVLAIAVAVLSAPSAVAATTLYDNDLAGWNAAVSNPTVIDFDTVVDGYTPPSLNSWATLTVNGFTLNGVTFTGYLDPGVLQSLVLSNYNSWGTGTVLKNATYTGGHANYYHLDMPTGGVTAWGVDLIAGGDYGTYTITFGTTTYTSPVSASTGTRFVGFTSDTPITSVNISYTNNYILPAIDNVRLATAGTSGGGGTDPGAETPEAASLLLCATGLLAVSRWRKSLTART